MKNSQLEKILHELGLTENESRVYLTSLSLGPSPILTIARAAEIRRTTVYAVVDSLKKKGLMYIEPRGFKQVYAAEHPDKLITILENKKNDFEKHLPEFISLYNLQSGESTIKYYEGLESVKTVYNTILDPMKPGEPYLVYSNFNKFFKMDDKYFRDFMEKRIASRVEARLIAIRDEESEYLDKYSKNFHHEVRYLPEGRTLSVDVMITPHKLAIINLEQPISAISIENQSMIKMHQELFEIMWESLPE